MDPLFWQLPGPARFLDRIRRSLRDGRNIVLALPEHGPERIRYAIADMVSRDDIYVWHPVDASEVDDGSEPAEVIARQCIPGTSFCTPKTLAEHEHFRGFIVWIDRISPSQWPRWRDFIVEYSYLCRCRAEHERAVFCMPLRGAKATALPAEDVTCSVHVWRGVLDRIDIMLLLSHLLADRSLPRLFAKLWIAVGAELAGTDAALAIRLAAAELSTIFSPKALLEAVARERGWSARSESGEAEWALGEADILDGKLVRHSARVVLDVGGAEEIERRVWQGQVGVLFPFLEDQRLDMLERLGRNLHVPFETTFGVITDVRDFELSHLLYQARKTNVDQLTRTRLARLTAIRHRLAHIEAVPYEELIAPELAVCLG
jgi:hypothetical protein